MIVILMNDTHADSNPSAPAPFTFLTLILILILLFLLLILFLSSSLFFPLSNISSMILILTILDFAHSCNIGKIHRITIIQHDDGMILMIFLVGMTMPPRDGMMDQDHPSFGP